MFSVHKKTKSHRFQIPPVLLRFRDGLVWTVGLTGEVKAFKFLRRRNTRYIKLHKPSTCRATFVSLQVLGRCFAFFTSRDQLVSQQKQLLRIEEMQRADWLICLVWIQDKLRVWWKTSKKAKICCSKETRALLFTRTFFNTQQTLNFNKSFCCATSWSRKVKNAKRETKKNEKHRPKACNQTMLRDKLMGFVFRISPPLKLVVTYNARQYPIIDG